MDNKLNSHEFFDELLYLIPEEVISNIYVDQNIDFLKEINFYLYKHYSEDRLTVNLAADLLENFLILSFKHKIPLCNILYDDYANSEEY